MTQRVESRAERRAPLTAGGPGSPGKQGHGVTMTRPGLVERSASRPADILSSTAPTPAYHRTPLRPLPKDPASVGRATGRRSSAPCDGAMTPSRTRQGARVRKRPSWPTDPARPANWSRRSTATGSTDEAKALDDKIAAGRAPAGSRSKGPPSRRRATQIRAPDDDPRLPRAAATSRANLDPLGIDCTPRNSRTGSRRPTASAEADLDRQIFIDNVLGLGYATPRQMSCHPAAAPTAATIGVEFMHLRSGREGLDCRSASRAGTRKSPSPRRAKRAILKKLVEAEGFETLPAQAISPAPSASASTAVKRRSGAGADHQARRRARRARDHPRHAASRPPERARRRDEQALPQASSTSSRAALHAGRTSMARATSSITSAPHRTAAFDGSTAVHTSTFTANPCHLRRNRQSGGARQGARQSRGKASTLRHQPKAGAAASCRCCSMATRPSPARASKSPNVSRLIGLKVSAPAAPIHFIVNNQIGFTTEPALSRAPPLSVWMSAPMVKRGSSTSTAA